MTGGLVSTGQGDRDQGSFEEAALKGRRYIRKKKKEAGLKSRPYTFGVVAEIVERVWP